MGSPSYSLPAAATRGTRGVERRERLGTREQKSKMTHFPIQVTRREDGPSLPGPRSLDSLLNLSENLS